MRAEGRATTAWVLGIAALVVAPALAKSISRTEPSGLVGTSTANHGGYWPAAREISSSRAISLAAESLATSTVGASPGWKRSSKAKRIGPR